MANKLELDRFDDCPTKEWLQSRIYTYIGTRMKSSVAMVAGPSIERQITNGFKIASTPKAKIYLIEKDMARYYKMCDRRYALIFAGATDVTAQWPECWWYRAIPALGDMSGYEVAAKLDKPVRFEDLDMCQTMRSIRYFVGHRLLLQSKLKGSFRKCMLITSSLRKCTVEDTLAILQQLLGDILGVQSSVWPGRTGDKHSKIYKEFNVKVYSPYIARPGRLLKNGLQFFSYADKSPMFSCIILYV